MKTSRIGAACLAFLFSSLPVAGAAILPGLGEISWTIARQDGANVPVSLYDAERKVGYAVFAVAGRYRANQMFPGRYDITIRKTGLEMAPVSVQLAADGKAQADLAPRAVAAPPNYTGGHTCRSVDMQPYDRIYPVGAGRLLVERACIVCYGVNFLPGKRFDRRTWESFVHYMMREPAFRNGGIVKGPSLVDPARIGDADMPLLLDDLAANFGTASKVRAVLQEQEPHFDQDGNVYVTDRGNPAMIVQVDPRTGRSKNFLTPGGGSSPHGLTVDGDGTVWWSGRDNDLAHLDPKTGLTDEYPVTQQGMHGHTPVFSSSGDLWFSMLVGNRLGHWSRATDTVIHYDTPSPRGHPYGLVIDHQDKVWYVEYFTDHVARFDPKDIIWYGVYGTVGKAGNLGRLDPKTGAVTERTLPIQYSNPYDTWPDDQDDVWISSDNYLTKFDPRTGKYTIYPTPERTDQPKIMLTRDGATWFTPRLSRDGARNPQMPGEKTVGRPRQAAGRGAATNGGNERVGD